MNEELQRALLTNKSMENFFFPNSYQVCSRKTCLNVPIEMNIISLMRNRIEGKEEVSETGDVEQVVRTVF